MKKNQIILIAIIILLYKISTDIVYKYLIALRFSYQGFIYDFSFSKYVISTLLVMMMVYPLITLF